LDRLKKYLRYLQYIIIAETILGGAGRIITFGSLTIRMALYGAAMLLFLVCLVMDWKHLIENINLEDLNIKLVILFLFWIVFSAVHGYLISGFSLLQIKGDVTGFLSLILIFPFCYAFNDKKYFDNIIKLISICIVLQSMSIIIIYFGIEMHLLNFDYVKLLISNLYLGSMTKIQPATTRIFFKSSIYIQVGIIILLGMLLRDISSKVKWKIYLSLIINCFALIISFTRGFWLAAIAEIFIYIILKGFKQFIKPFCIVILGIFLLIGVNYGVNRNTKIIESIVVRTGIIHIAGVNINDNPDVSAAEAITEKSLEYRQKLQGEMIKRIIEKPIIGTGFGVILSNIGQQVSHSEYMYLDIILEMGLIGFVLYISILLILFLRWLSVRRKLSGKYNFMDEYMLGFLSVVITSSFNPFLNNPIGIMFLAVVFALINTYYKKSLSRNEVKLKL